jgi:uncharacterized protein (DUF433 family)
MMAHERITRNPAQMSGLPCIRGLRIPVKTVLAMLADGMTRDEILAALPDLEDADIAAALLFAADVVTERTLARVDPAA